MLAMKSNRLLAAALMVAALLLSGACGSDDKADGGTKPSSSPTTPATKLIDYEKDNNGGVEIQKAADVSKLVGAPDDFKQFIAGVIDQAVQSGGHDKTCPVTVGVSKLDTSGFATGGITDCGGAAFIWAKRDGVWQQIWGGQTTPGCDDMKKYSVPKAIAGDKCWDGKNEVAYNG